MDSNYFEEFEEMEAEKGMTVVACYPGKTAQVIEIDGSLESMQQFVGGYLQALSSSIISPVSKSIKQGAW